ncbi:hypothetical protein SUDANB145_01311 [Streptomyces sp. enrichment culture]
MERQAHRGGPVAVGTRPVDEAAEEKADDKTGGKNGGKSGEQAGGKNGEQAGDAMDGASRIRCRLRRRDLGAVPEARRALRELLRRWGRPDRSEVALLLAGELVTNALVHTDRDAVLTATVGPRVLRVEVRDFVSRWPRPRAVDAGDSTSGRGLLLVQSLADAWGVRAHAVGKSVWFELDAGPA